MTPWVKTFEDHYYKHRNNIYILNLSHIILCKLPAFVTALRFMVFVVPVEKDPL